MAYDLFSTVANAVLRCEVLIDGDCSSFAAGEAGAVPVQERWIFRGGFDLGEGEVSLYIKRSDQLLFLIILACSSEDFDLVSKLRKSCTDWTFHFWKAPETPEARQSVVMRIVRRSTAYLKPLAGHCLTRGVNEIKTCIQRERSFSTVDYPTLAGKTRLFQVAFL